MTAIFVLAGAGAGYILPRGGILQERLLYTAAGAALGLALAMVLA